MNRLRNQLVLIFALTVSACTSPRQINSGVPDRTLDAGDIELALDDTYKPGATTRLSDIKNLPSSIEKACAQLGFDVENTVMQIDSIFYQDVENSELITLEGSLQTVSVNYFNYYDMSYHVVELAEYLAEDPENRRPHSYMYYEGVGAAFSVAVKKGEDVFLGLSVSNIGFFGGYDERDGDAYEPESYATNHDFDVN